MIKKLFVLVVILLIVPWLFVFGQADFDEVEIKATHVAGSVYMLEGRGGNIGVSVGEDGVLLIDDQFAPLADKIRAAVDGIGGGELKFVLNTHWHSDHTSGNEVLGKEAPIIAHHNVRKRLMTQQETPWRVVDPIAEDGWPVITFEESLSLHFNGEEIRVMHLPRVHTDGDAVVFFPESGVVHLGDLMFSGFFPYVDLGSGGDVDALIDHVEKLIGKLDPDVKLIPGHGPLSTLDDLKAYHEMLVSTAAFCREKISAGTTLDELKAQGLPEKWKSWGGGFVSEEFWIEIVYNDTTNPTGK